MLNCLTRFGRIKICTPHTTKCRHITPLCTPFNTPAITTRSTHTIHSILNTKSPRHDTQSPRHNTPSLRHKAPLLRHSTHRMMHTTEDLIDTPLGKKHTTPDTQKYGRLMPYTPPSFCWKDIHVPKYRIQMSQLPTPIHPWLLPGLPEGVTVGVKRDDMTGSTLSGNKIRKLEFLLADAISNGCKHIITCGGVGSNHCRATAIASKQLGLECHLLLRSSTLDPNEITLSGNVFMDVMCGANIYLVPKTYRMVPHLQDGMEQLAKRLQTETGEKACIVPLGGSDKVGTWGYIEAFNEMIHQGVLEDYDDIVFAVGSAGTGEGLAMARHMFGSNIRLHGVMVCDDAAYHHGHANDVFRDIGIHDITSELWT